MKKLSDKQKLFCCYFFLLRNPRIAALRAGYPSHKAEKAALSLLGTPAVQAEIQRCEKSICPGDPTAEAVAGLRQIAFGSAADILQLVLYGGEGLSAQKLEQMDLSLISEIRCLKDGAIEVKFFNRLKALELLLGYRSPTPGQGCAQSLFRALELGAQALDKDSHA